MDRQLKGTGGEQVTTDDAFVARLGSDGRRIWTHRVVRPGFQVAHDIRPFPDGSLLVVGYGFVEERNNIDAFALRILESGRVIWEHTFGGKTYDRANHGLVFADGSSVIVGYSQRLGAADEETGWDLVIYRLDPEGIPVWSRRFGGEGYEFGRGIAGEARDIWVVGHTSSGRSGSSVLLIRTDLTTPDRE